MARRIIHLELRGRAALRVVRRDDDAGLIVPRREKLREIHVVAEPQLI